MKELFTIGYSAFSLDSFMRTLKKYGITAVADVRSVPYSAFYPAFNRENLKATLHKQGIFYVFLGNNCGARIEVEECYSDGKADYRLIASHPRFQKGLNRIKNGMSKYKISLMCAERDPLNCHRSILICRNLRSSELRISHILPDGSLENHNKTEERLLTQYGFLQTDFFKSPQQRLEEAYDLQGCKIAYARKPSFSNDSSNAGETDVDW